MCAYGWDFGFWAAVQPDTGANDADRGLCGPHGGDQRTDAEDVHDALEIVGQHVQGHLGADLLEGAHLEVGRSHPRLDGAERMLDGISPGAHHPGVLVEPALDRLDDTLVFGARDRGAGS